MPGEGLVDGRVELLGRERLGQVAVGPDADARGPMVGVVQGGDHDDRDQVRLAVPLELVADGEPVDVGQHQVEQDQVGRVLLGRRRRPAHPRRAGPARSREPGPAGQDIVGVALIVDDQHGARHGQSSKGLRKIDRFLSCTTTEDMVLSIVTRQPRHGKSLQRTMTVLRPTNPAPANQP